MQKSILFATVGLISIVAIFTSLSPARAQQRALRYEVVCNMSSEFLNTDLRALSNVTVSVSAPSFAPSGPLPKVCVTVGRW